MGKLEAIKARIELLKMMFSSLVVMLFGLVSYFFLHIDTKSSLLIIVAIGIGGAVCAIVMNLISYERRIKELERL